MHQRGGKTRKSWETRTAERGDRSIREKPSLAQRRHKRKDEETGAYVRGEVVADKRHNGKEEETEA